MYIRTQNSVGNSSISASLRVSLSRSVVYNIKCYEHAYNLMSCINFSMFTQFTYTRNRSIVHVYDQSFDTKIYWAVQSVASNNLCGLVSPIHDIRLNRINLISFIRIELAGYMQFSFNCMLSLSSCAFTFKMIYLVTKIVYKFS